MKKPVKKKEKVAKEVKPKDYHLVMKFNDQVFEALTDDLAGAILAFAPKFLKTKIVFHIEKDGKSCDRQMFVQRGKMIFRSQMFRDTFIRKLIFK